MEVEKKRGWWALAVVVVGSVLLLLALYVGAYYATVNVGLFSTQPTIFPVYTPHWLNRYPVFDPIHYADRYWIRPRSWDNETLDAISEPVQYRSDALSGIAN